MINPAAMEDVVARLSSGDSFEGEVFENIDAQGGDLRGKEFSRCTFRNAKLQQTRWARARLEDCVLDGCDLSNALPAQLALRGVELRNCKLIGVDWSGLQGYPAVTFVDCNLRYASFVDVDLRKIRFERCTLSESAFVRVNLAQALFDACQLAGARFDACDLRGASFARSEGFFADPAKNKVQGLRIPLGSAALLAASFGMSVVD